MKKRLFSLVTIASLALVVLAGCSNPNIDTAKVKAGLQPALDAGQRVQLDLALSAIEAGKYKDAAAPLRKIAFTAKLNADQNQLLKDTMAKVQARAAKGQ